MSARATEAVFSPRAARETRHGLVLTGVATLVRCLPRCWAVGCRGCGGARRQTAGRAGRGLLLGRKSPPRIETPHTSEERTGGPQQQRVRPDGAAYGSGWI